MQEELLQESGEQMLARVEYALRQEHAAVSWGLPSPLGRVAFVFQHCGGLIVPAIGT